jgi:general secretion pathway protein G
MNDPMKNPSLGGENCVNGFPCSKYFNRSGCNRGFTLIEIMIVIAIIGTLSAIALPNYIRYRNEALIVSAITDIRMIEERISIFAFENDGQPPDSLNDLPNYVNHNDPWGNPYQYLRIAGVSLKGKDKIKPRKDHNTHPVNSDYDLCSMGKDGQTHVNFTVGVSQDDIVRANNGGYVGLVSNY